MKKFLILCAIIAAFAGFLALAYDYDCCDLEAWILEAVELDDMGNYYILVEEWENNNC